MPMAHKPFDPSPSSGGARDPPLELSPFGKEVDSLSGPMRRLVRALLLYKSMYTGPWFESLGVEEDPRTRSLYQSITRETWEQARATMDLLHRWDAMAPQEATESLTEQVLTRLLEDMLTLKKSSTEVFLSAGIGAPSEEMRREFLRLADMDRRHAEALRQALGVRLPKDTPEPETRRFAGVHTGPFAAGTLSDTVQRSLDQARAAGQEPRRLVMSDTVLRHLRDEGSVPPGQGDVFGLPVDIDLGWQQEAFAIISRSRISLAEIVTEMESGH